MRWPGGPEDDRAGGHGAGLKWRATSKVPVHEVGQEWGLGFATVARGMDPVFVVDGDGLVMRLSRPIGSIRPSDVIGRPLSACVVEEAQALETAIQNARHPGIAQALEAPVPSGQGRRWYRFHVMPAGEHVLVQAQDVDAQHREIDHLRAAQQIMRDTQGISHMGIWTWDITQPHAIWSRELYNIYGLDPSHVPTYQDYLTRVHPDDVGYVQAATEAAFRDHQPYSHDERIRHTDGSWRHLHTWARPVLEDGKLVALHGVCMDITQRKEAELALARSEARHKAILENAGLGIATLRPDGVVEDANPAFLELLGSHESGSLWEMLSAQGAESARAFLDGVFTSSRLASETIIETRHDPPRWIRLVMSLVEEEEPAFVVAVAQDVTAEHAAEAAQQRINSLEQASRDRARRIGVASHEVKNPLTPLFLQLELLRRVQEPSKQARIVERMEVQLRRLEGLVQDFLQTARAEEGRLDVRPQEMDLVHVVRSIVEGRRVMAEGFGVGLALEAPDAAALRGDPGRLAQVVDNLVANALRFTPEGAGVVVRVARDGPAWLVEVEDEGVGIPKERQALLFQPYAHAGVAPAHPGTTTGLGLYVCKAIVEAHGGAIGLDSHGSGTRAWFRVPA